MSQQCLEILFKKQLTNYTVYTHQTLLFLKVSLKIKTMPDSVSPSEMAVILLCVILILYELSTLSPRLY